MAWINVAMAAGGAVMGAEKNKHAKAQENSDRALAAETQRYSPWTKMQAGPIRNAGSQFGDVFGGGVQGAMMGQSLQKGFAGLGGAAKPDVLAGGGGMGTQEAGQMMSPEEKLLQDPYQNGPRVSKFGATS